MRIKPATLLSAVVLLSAAAVVGEAHAQRPGSLPYQFSRPPISPYFDLFRRDTTGLPSYYQFVRPQLQFQRYVETETARVQRLQNEMQLQGGAQLRQRLGAPGDPSAVQLRATAQGAVPRTAATFMNHSHYFPAPPPVRQAR
jgi:hypothetical protein